MKPDSIGNHSQHLAVNKAFSKQSEEFDSIDHANPILRDMRMQVYCHVESYLKPGSMILELNAGTGMDALYFVRQGHKVHATDLSDGMIRQIENKISMHHLHHRLSCQQISYDLLDQVDRSHGKFDFVFSNFGGLNCIRDLSEVTHYLPSLLKPGAYVTWVIMPTVCLWEISAVFKGHVRHAFRRFSRDGAISHLEGEHFKTYYHSLSEIRKAFGNSFSFVQSEGLGALSPQPHHTQLVSNFPRLYHLTRMLDWKIRNVFPFNRWADHIIVTFQFRK